MQLVQGPAGSMARASYFARFCAIAAMLFCSGDLAAAVPLFEKHCPNHGLREDLHEFCSRWWDNYKNRSEGVCFLHDPPRSGRPKKLEKTDIKRAAKAFAKGYYSHGKKMKFTSLEQVCWAWPAPRPAHAQHRTRPTSTQRNPCHNPRPWPSPCVQAVKKSPVLQDIVKRARCTPQHLWRVAKVEDPKLRFVMESLKPAFTEAEMKERVEFCYKMLSEPPEWLHGIVFMDESSVPLSPRPIHVIGRKGEEALRLDPRTRKDKRQVEYIHYLLSVCWATGLVKLDILSYTDGYNDPVQYYVSPPLPADVHTPC